MRNRVRSLQPKALAMCFVLIHWLPTVSTGRGSDPDRLQAGADSVATLSAFASLRVTMEEPPQPFDPQPQAGYVPDRPHPVGQVARFAAPQAWLRAAMAPSCFGQLDAATAHPIPREKRVLYPLLLLGTH